MQARFSCFACGRHARLCFGLGLQTAARGQGCRQGPHNPPPTLASRLVMRALPIGIDASASAADVAADTADACHVAGRTERDAASSWPAHPCSVHRSPDVRVRACMCIHECVHVVASAHHTLACRHAITHLHTRTACLTVRRRVCVRACACDAVVMMVMLRAATSMRRSRPMWLTIVWRSLLRVR